MNTPSSSLWKHRAFQQLFWAHALSLLGSGLSSLALGLLAHHLVGAAASSVLGVTLAIRIFVIVLCSPWAGKLADRYGARKLMVVSDLMRAVVVIGFFYAESVWQIYALAVLLNLGSAIFTPIYRAVIPGVVSKEQYPSALAVGSVAYDTANILGPSLAAFAATNCSLRTAKATNAPTFTPPISPSATRGGVSPIRWLDSSPRILDFPTLIGSLLVFWQSSRFLTGCSRFQAPQNPQASIDERPQQARA